MAVKYGVKLENGHTVSRSAASAIAEEGMMRLAGARKTVRLALGISAPEAEHLLWLSWSGEWHHVGNNASRVEFFNAGEAIAFYGERLAGKYACSAWELDPEQCQHAGGLTKRRQALQWANSKGWLEIKPRRGIFAATAHWKEVH
jgi:hypothetical protein